MKNYLKSLICIVSISFLLMGCSNDDEMAPPNYVTFENNSPVNIGVEVGESATHEITVYTANLAENDRTFEIEVAAASTLQEDGYDVPATVTIPGGSNMGSFTVEVSDINLGLTGKNLVLNLQEGKEQFAGEPYTIVVNRTCVGTEFKIDFTFDGYASEIDWVLEDANGEALVTGGNYDDGLASTSQLLCLSPGNYTFNVSDSYGDGLTYPNVGIITLSYAGEVLETIPGDFGNGATVEVNF